MKTEINCEDFFEQLESRGFTHLYHANSVETSISYFRVASILSRHQCNSQSLHQSDQWSDNHDQKHGIWDDIFVNFNDFHILFKCPNSYGPILFQINLQHLKKEILARALKIHITKTQPHKWNSQTVDDDKWQKDINSVFLHPAGTSTQMYIKGWADIVISGSETNGLPIQVCDNILIDENPNNVNFYSQVSSAFQNCLDGHGINLQISKRNCVIPKCKCKAWSHIEEKNNQHKYISGNWTSTYGKIA